MTRDQKMMERIKTPATSLLQAHKSGSNAVRSRKTAILNWVYSFKPLA